MKGYIGIDIPTKRYIAAYLRAQMGEKPIADRNHFIGQKFLDLLCRDVKKEEGNRFGSNHYNTHVRIYINMHFHAHRGHCIREDFVKDFNRFIELFLKERIAFLINIYIKTNTLEQSIEMARADLHIDEEDWSRDCIARYYHRYRKRQDIPLLYLKKTPDRQEIFLREVSDLIFPHKKAI